MPRRSSLLLLVGLGGAAVCTGPARAGTVETATKIAGAAVVCGGASGGVFEGLSHRTKLPPAADYSISAAGGLGCFLLANYVGYRRAVTRRAEMLKQLKSTNSANAVLSTVNKAESAEPADTSDDVSAYELWKILPPSGKARNTTVDGYYEAANSREEFSSYKQIRSQPEQVASHQRTRLLKHLTHINSLLPRDMQFADLAGKLQREGGEQAMSAVSIALVLAIRSDPQLQNHAELAAHLTYFHSATGLRRIAVAVRPIPVDK